MLRTIRSSIFDSPAQTLVNTVNTVGVMGKGIAKEFKARHPSMFREYKKLCDDRVLQIGTLHLWRGPSRWVLNFPTKTTWKLPSRLSYIESGLQTFAQNYKQMGVRSISFPPLGCGNGNLDWNEVRPLMLQYLWDLDIAIYIHDKQVGEQFQPEHRDSEATLPPVSFDEFLSDVKSAIYASNGAFKTLKGDKPFKVHMKEGSAIEVYADRKIALDDEFMVTAWVGLQVGMLTTQTFGDKAAQRAACYLMPILGRLPYVNFTQIQINPNNPDVVAFGMYLNSTNESYDDIRVVDKGSEQRCLFQ